ncbi:MAG: CgeB family protein [Gammaproteobacteria bacterium]
MRIAYIGSQSGTSLQRAKALKRLGHTVTLIGPWEWLARSTLRARLHFHTGYFGVDHLIKSKLVKEVLASQPDLIWVNQGEFLGPVSVQALRGLGVSLVNYANDNPFSVENRKRFSNYRAALPYYDLVVVLFAEAVEAAKRAGARRVIRQFHSADEVAHLQQLAVVDADAGDRSEAAFVGTWMKEHRGAFVAELIRYGLPLSVWGDQWQKAKEWPIVRPHWRGPGVYDNRGYAQIIRGAKICLGLVNKASGNLHTDRSIQIPALGSLLCAERTSEHLALYKEGEEAVFWSDAEECAAQCKELLADEPRRQEIARRGHERAIRNNLFNEPVLASILEQVPQ